MFGFKRLNSSINSNAIHVYSYIFDFESYFESKSYVDSWQLWMKDNWKISIICSIVYIGLVFLGKSLMHNRQKFEIRLPLILWNIFLALFSIIGTVRMWPDFIYSLSQHGYVYTVCNNDSAYGLTGFWTFLFILSKLPELIDTLFIILRKQNLIFLHWYHHATVLIYCWYSYQDFSASGRWFAAMNYFVHSIMYTYYAFRAMRFKIPKFVSQVITMCQLIQMVIGCLINYTVYDILTNSSSTECANSYENITYSSIMYFTYFILFFNFFLNAYVIKKREKQVSQTIISNEITSSKKKL